MSAPASFAAGVEARFAATTVAAGTGGWRPAGEFLDAASARLGELIATERGARDAPSDAVAGTLLVLEYTRLLSWPVLAAAVRDGAWLDPAADNVQVFVGDPRLARMGFVSGPGAGRPGSVPAAGVPAGASGTAERAVRASLDGHVADLVAAVHTRTRVGRRVLWSNVAAAVAGGFLALSWTMPDRAGLVTAARGALDADPRLRGLVIVTATEQGGENWMRVTRRGCCLAFRCAASDRAQPHYCGTCPLLDDAEQERRFHHAAARYREFEARAHGPAAAAPPG